jgi:protein-disulfide isomerase
VFEARVKQELELVSALLGKDDGAADPRTPYARLQELATAPAGLAPVVVDTPGPDVPSLGPASAPVVVQMFTDFECGFCRRVMPTLDALRARYPERVRLVWRHLPLPFHARALPAARLALAVRDRHGDGAFWKLVRHLLGSAEQQPAPLDTESLVSAGQTFGLEPEQARAALHSPQFDAQITRDVNLAQSLGIDGTPSFVINGYRLVGAQPLPRFERLVRLALERAQVHTAGSPPSNPSLP